MSTTQTLQNKNTNQAVYPNCPQRITFAYNLVINSNGVQFRDNYKWSSEQSYGDYTFRAFQRSNGGYETDINVIKEYLSFMVGSDFVPEYNINNPHDVFIFTQYDNTPWKYQLTNIGGADILCAFKVNNFPFALKNEIPNIEGMAKIRTEGTTVSYSDKHERTEATFYGCYAPFVMKMCFEDNLSESLTVVAFTVGYSTGYYIEGSDYFDGASFGTDGEITLYRGDSSSSGDPDRYLHGVVISSLPSQN